MVKNILQTEKNAEKRLKKNMELSVFLSLIKSKKK